MALPIGHILTDKSIKQMERLLYSVKRAIQNTSLPGDDSIDHEESPAPEAYIARTPAVGIPGIYPEDVGTDAVPSFARCTVYRLSLVTRTMEPLAFQKDIFNISPVAIDGDKWVIVLRDKFGIWYAVDSFPSEGGFPAELISEYRTESGYDWAQLKLLEDGTFDYHENGNVGVNAYTPDEDQDLRRGTRGWLFPNPDHVGTSTSTSTAGVGTGSGTGTSDEYYVFIPVYKRRVSCGTGGHLVNQISLDGGITWIDEEDLGADCDTGTGTYQDDVVVGGCGWVAGLRPENCLRLTVVTANGRCADIDITQELTLSWNGTCWQSGLSTPGTFSTGTADDDFIYVDGQGPAIFCITNGIPTLTIDGIYLILNRCGSVNGVNFIEFSGGNLLCEPPGTGADPVDCEDNTFVVRLVCVECPMHWYCVATEGTCDETGTGDVIEALELTDFEADELGELICSGPYMTEEEALAVCASDIQTTCCVDPIPATLTLTLTDCACRASSFPVTYNASGANGAGWYSQTFNDCNARPQYFRFYCDVTGPDLWRVDEYCDGVLSGTGAATAGSCNLVTGITGSMALSGNCCDLNTLFTITA